jgi:hypothetical protein
MARARSPNRDKAFEIYKNYDGGMYARKKLYKSIRSAKTEVR